MDLAQFCEVLNKVSNNEKNKENVPPRAPTAPIEHPTQSNDQRVPYPWGWLRKQIPLIQDGVIKFSTNPSLIPTNSGTLTVIPMLWNMIISTPSLQK